MFEQYPYLGAALLLAATIPGYLALAGSQRRAAAWSGVLLAPWALVGPLFGDDYWVADRLGGVLVGIEDFIYNGQLGVASWFFATLLLRSRLQMDLRLRSMLPRSLLLASGLAVALAAGVSAGVSAMTWAIAVAAAFAAVLLVLRFDLWPLALSAALLHGTALSITLSAMQALWPQFAGTWVSSHPLSARVFGVPLGEVLWGFVAPAGHAMAFGFIARVRLLRPGTMCQPA
jgi:hypothetical protein